jgi:excisionase family DNA binding protein
MTHLLSFAQAAQRLGVSRQRVHALVKEGRIPTVQVGPYRLIEPTALTAFERLPAGYPKGRPRK